MPNTNLLVYTEQLPWCEYTPAITEVQFYIGYIVSAVRNVVMYCNNSTTAPIFHENLTSLLVYQGCRL